MSPVERIGSTAPPGAIGSRYAGFAVLKPGSFADDAPPAIVSVNATAIAARAVSRLIRVSPPSLWNSNLGGGTPTKLARPRRPSGGRRGRGRTVAVALRRVTDSELVRPHQQGVALHRERVDL